MKPVTANIFPHSIAHGFFTREGGVSEALFASLNCGPGSGDDLEKVVENRRRVQQYLGAGALLSGYQIHGRDVAIVTEAWDKPPKADALVTNRPHIAIGVLTADCVPVLIADPDAGVIAAVHSGWKGAHADIIGAALEAMRGLGAHRFIAAIGPAILQDSYEVGEDLRAAFLEKDVGFAAYFREEGRQWRFDLTGLVHYLLKREGVEAERLAIDTYTEEARFFSFRRATHRAEKDYGRQISAIMLK